MVPTMIGCNAPMTVALHESPETRLVVIGDSAFLSDFVARTIGQVDGNFFVENLRFIENVIDWTTLDNDMMAIRARGLASRRLDRISPKAQIGIEATCYIVTLLLLGALAMNMRRRRDQVVPITSSEQPTEPSETQSQEA